MLHYPPARRDTIVETLHGVDVADPYRWLEDGASVEVQGWTEAQNALTRGVLDRCHGREGIRARVEALTSIGWLFAPVVRNGRSFYVRRDGAQDQPVLYWRPPGGDDRVLVDPVADSGLRTIAIDWWYPSPDGRLVAYGVSRDGDEQSTLRIRRVDDGTDLTEAIPRTRFCSVAWLPDASAFYYTRFPLPGTVPPADEEYGRRVFLHRLAADWRDDEEVFGAALPKERVVWVGISPDGRWFWIGVWHSTGRNDLYLLDRHAPRGGFVTVAEGLDARFMPDAQPDAL
jgi:prolyl oligopeptidase